jgi:two-component system, sensor histidine kinase and response regulator
MNDRGRASILLVDDNTNNLGVLYRYLDDEGFTVLVSQDGERAIRLARDQKPDLILLDVMLPGMTGFEACEVIKADPATADIPVIFISALADVQDKVRGFQAGGVDYVTKPFQQEEVLARINAHVTIKRQREELDRLNATKDRLFSVIGHDLRGPFMGLLGALELLRDSGDDIDPQTTHELISNLYDSAETTYYLLENLLEWSRSQQRLVEMNRHPIKVGEIIAGTVQLFQAGARQKGIHVSTDVPEHLTAFADRNMIGTVLRNLVSNAVKFTPSGGSVSITARESDRMVEIELRDTGIGIPPKDRDALFSLERSVTRSGTGGEKGSGLGLLLAHDYVARNGGTIDVESNPGDGTCFRVRLPAHAVAAQPSGR